MLFIKVWRKIAFDICFIGFGTALTTILYNKQELIHNIECHYKYNNIVNKGNNKITELRTILQRESQNSYVYKQTKSVNNRSCVLIHHFELHKCLMFLICILNIPFNENA
jgi:hypothetical protein